MFSHLFNTSTMNYLVLSYILFFVSHNVCSQDTGSCDPRVTDLNGNGTDMRSYCSSDRPCVVKCCAENEVINSSYECMNIEDLKERLNNNLTNIPFDFSGLEIYKNDNYDEKSSKSFKIFTILYSEMYMSKNATDCSFVNNDKKRLTEKGTLLLPQPNHYLYWDHVEDFCVDMVVGLNRVTHVPMFIIYYKILRCDETSEMIKTVFDAIGMVISAFFLFLVLVVYSILHQLRNIQGMLLYAYVATLMAGYLMKASYILYALNNNETQFDCTVVTQLTYFLVLASFFWLKLMSFDIWWTFRGTRKVIKIHRRGIHLKMLIYSCYAFGMPAAMTTFAAIMDANDLPPHIVKPMFETCFLSDTFFVYLFVPIMILTGCNCVLFVMTMYNMWLIRRNVKSFDEATTKKNVKNQNRFMVYIKLSALMGVSWIIEVIQARVPTRSVPVWLYILLNAYNALIGLVIFFLFVFKPKIFHMLCNRFNIKRWAHRQYKVDSSTRTDLSKGSKTYSRSCSGTKSTIDCDREEDIALNKVDQRNRMVCYVPDAS